MLLGANTFKVTGVLAVVCAVLAVCTIWVLLTDPITVAHAVDSRNLDTIFGLLTRAFTDAFRAVVRYL